MTPTNVSKRSLQDDLMIFMEAYGGVRVTAYSRELVYKTTPGYGKKASVNANTLLKDIGLGDRLEAVADDNNWLSNDSFIVKEKTNDNE